uniref:SWIRM domain-containing protein n=1 Tax=Angiostrongylus cantonensis TaxID=6313 RepID=A0A158PBJ7_ANGCA
MSNYLKTLADTKKATVKVKPTPGRKKAPKATLKVGKGSNKQMFADYGGADDYDGYSDDDNDDFIPAQNTSSWEMTCISENSRNRNDYFSESPDSESIRQMLEDGELDTVRWEDDDIALRSAASHSRLPFDKLTVQELTYFPDVSDSKASTNLYLFIRNKILQLWLLEPNVELTSEDAIEQLPIPFNSDRRLVRRIHGFLKRYGFINFGNFHRLASAPVLTSKRKRVIIIGAGSSGIAALKQLHYFGFDVVLLEARMALYKKSAVFLANKIRMPGGSISYTLDPDERLEADILRRCYKRDLGEAIRLYDVARERLRNLDTTLRNLKKQEPSEVYMNQRDRRLLDFHFASLECVSGGTLDKLSLQYFDQEDEFQFAGSHMAIRDGYGDFLTRLVTSDVAGLIRQSAVVETIKYNEKGVEVHYKKDGKVSIVEGDVCLCTIPLGVLKRSVNGSNDAPKFDPLLPENTVVLIFSRPFWDVTQNYFGHLNHSKASRGEMFLFTALSQAPVLIAMMAGEAANLEAPNEVIVRKAMNVLANIFGSACPKGGAWLSGVREAARIAGVFLGCPFSASHLTDPECVLLDSDDDENDEGSACETEEPEAAYLTNTLMFRDRLRDSCTKSAYVMEPFDITVLYTNVSNDSAMEIIREFVEQHEEQLTWLAMGQRLAPTLTVAFMPKVEAPIIDLRALLYCRYTGDYLVIYSTQEKMDKYFELLNEQLECIKFTREKPKENWL